MDKKKTIIICLAVLLIGLTSFKIYQNKNDNQNGNPKDGQNEVTKDAKKFKSEYESLNGKENAKGTKYLNLSIEDNNPIIYEDDMKINDIITNGTGVIYFGYNTCPWCRSMIETLLESASVNNIDKVYYVDIKDIRSTYEIKNKKLEQTKKGSDGYYKILDNLKDYLTDYILTDDKDKEYPTDEKRLYAPTVVFVKDGKILNVHEGTVDTQEDPSKGLTDDEKKVLLKEFNKYMKELKDTTCANKTGC